MKHDTRARLKQFKWICGDEFQVKLSPNKRIIRVYLKEYWEKRWYLRRSYSVSGAILLANGKWVCLGNRYELNNRIGAFGFIFSSLYRAKKAQAVAQEVLKYLRITWKKKKVKGRI